MTEAHSSSSKEFEAHRIYQGYQSGQLLYRKACLDLQRLGVPASAANKGLHTPLPNLQVLVPAEIAQFLNH